MYKNIIGIGIATSIISTTVIGIVTCIISTTVIGIVTYEAIPITVVLSTNPK
jgi:hypothetical protein